MSKKPKKDMENIKNGSSEMYIKQYLTFCIIFVGEIRWLEGLNVKRTEKVLGKISEMVFEWIYIENSISKGTMYGIEVLNEPWGKVTFNLFTIIIMSICR